MVSNPCPWCGLPDQALPLCPNCGADSRAEEIRCPAEGCRSVLGLGGGFSVGHLVQAHAWQLSDDGCAKNPDRPRACYSLHEQVALLWSGYSALAIRYREVREQKEELRRIVDCLDQDLLSLVRTVKALEARIDRTQFGAEVRLRSLENKPA